MILRFATKKYYHSFPKLGKEVKKGIDVYAQK